MAAMQRLLDLLALRFGPEWKELTGEQQVEVLRDFAAMLREEYDTPDDTMDEFTAQENAHQASREYRRRIGGGNLASYAKTLLAGTSTKGRCIP